MPALGFVWDVLLFALAVFGLGAALAPATGGPALARFAFGTLLATGFWFAAGFTGFAAGVGNGVTAAGSAAAAAALLGLRWRQARACLGEAEVRTFLGVWLLFACWTLGLLALIKSYSGGGWAADWVEHWQRTVFFLERQSLETVFIERYALTARPPLVNLLVALWLEGTTPSFEHFQVGLCLFGSLVLLPLAALATGWSGDRRALHWLVLVGLATPLVAQNLTFAWTKMPAAFFVLVAFVAVAAAPARRLTDTECLLAGTAAGLGALAHYSALPWLCALGAGLVAVAWRRDRLTASMKPTTLILATAGACLLAWLGWATARYGWTATVGSTTTAAAWEAQAPAERVRVFLHNVFTTVVPFPLRGEPPGSLIVQASALGRLRDVAFNVYQLNLPLSVGLGGLWALAATLRRDRSTTQRDASGGHAATFFAVTLTVAVILGIAVHTPPDAWGLVHICLQPLTLLALAKVAAVLASGDRRLRLGWAVFAAVDFLVGVALHFGLQARAWPTAVANGPGDSAYLAALSVAARVNAADQEAFGLTFLADRLGAPVAITGFLTLLLGVAIWRAVRGR